MMTDIIRITGLVLKSLFKKPACGMYPFKPAKFYDRTRGSIAITPEKCTLCTLCDKKCPTHAIKVDRPGRTWEINRHQCILCSACVECCRFDALVMANQYSKPTLEKKVEVVSIPGG